jgi:hypothetical protein
MPTLSPPSPSYDTPSYVPCGWLPATLDPRRAHAVRWAWSRIGVEEFTTNASPTITNWIAAAGGRPGDPWCAAFVYVARKEAGLWVPPRGVAMSCDGWRIHADRAGLWLPKDALPQPGDVAVYGVPGDANHCGLVARTHVGNRVSLRDVEGNTTWAGYSREGNVVAPKPVNRPKLLGYVRGMPL